MKYTIWIIWNSGNHMYIVPFFCPMESYIITPKYFWIEILADKEYLLSTIFHCLFKLNIINVLPHDYVHCTYSKDFVLSPSNFYLEKLNFDKLHFVSKLCSHSDGKTVFSTNQIKDFITQMIKEAVENFMNNPMDSSYISESFVVTVSNYMGKHYISVCPRIDFSK